MKWRNSLVLTVIGASLALAACDVDVKDEGKMPDVDVSVEEGRMPDIDVRGPDVDVGTKQTEITVPDIDVDIPQENDPEQNSGNTSTDIIERQPG